MRESTFLASGEYVLDIKGPGQVCIFMGKPWHGNLQIRCSTYQNESGFYHLRIGPFAHYLPNAFCLLPNCHVCLIIPAVLLLNSACVPANEHPRHPCIIVHIAVALVDYGICLTSVLSRPLT